MRARTSARALGAKRREIYRWKLFHREERPALERNIIDTSEWACANYRHVMGQHFDLLKHIRSALASLQLYAISEHW